MTANTLVLRNMVGVVVFMAVVTAAGLALGRHPDPPPYTPSPVANTGSARDPVAAGAALFERKGCTSCHTTDGSPRVGPSLGKRWGTTVALADGTRVVFDERYVRESLAMPQARAQPGYPPSMPSFDGLIKEREVAALVSYLRQL